MESLILLLIGLFGRYDKDKGVKCAHFTPQPDLNTRILYFVYDFEEKVHIG